MVLVGRGSGTSSAGASHSASFRVFKWSHGWGLLLEQERERVRRGGHHGGSHLGNWMLEVTSHHFGQFLCVGKESLGPFYATGGGYAMRT